MRADPTNTAPTSTDLRTGAMDSVQSEVRAIAELAATTADHLARADQPSVDQALRAMGAGLLARSGAVIAANRVDLETALATGARDGLVDRLRLTPERITALAAGLEALADAPTPPRQHPVRTVPEGMVVQVNRPIGVIGANFEARPNVAVDIASQLIKSRNAGVLRTGAAALNTAATIVDQVVAPALTSVGLPAESIQLIRATDHRYAQELVRQPGLIPLVILRGSGTSTRALAELAAVNGVRTLSHADGGAVMYLDRAADQAKIEHLVTASLDRLGVCNRLNLLLIHRDKWSETIPAVRSLLAGLRPPIAMSMPPHQHPLGYEWALDPLAEATVTVAPVAGPLDAARIANEQTSGLAASIVTEDAEAAMAFLDLYAGTGAFWNARPRLLDGQAMLGIPETGISTDRVPGPRGPVTFADLWVRQYRVLPVQAVPGEQDQDETDQRQPR